MKTHCYKFTICIYNLPKGENFRQNWKNPLINKNICKLKVNIYLELCLTYDFYLCHRAKAKMKHHVDQFQADSG